MERSQFMLLNISFSVAVGEFTNIPLKYGVYLDYIAYYSCPYTVLNLITDRPHSVYNIISVLVQFLSYHLIAPAIGR